jgi:hypothetical protein
MKCTEKLILSYILIMFVLTTAVSRVSLFEDGTVHRMKSGELYSTQY